jgi:hypothetical protein
LITDGPVLVTVEAASTLKLPAVPRPIGASAAAAGRMPTARAIAMTARGTVTPSHQRPVVRLRSRGGEGRWIVRLGTVMPCLEVYPNRNGMS